MSISGDMNTCEGGNDVTARCTQRRVKGSASIAKLEVCNGRS